MPESDRYQVVDVVRHAKRLLNSNTRTELDAISTDIASATTSTIHLKYQTEGIRAGSYISLSSGTTPPETMYVHSRNGEYATVMRGVDGSSAPSTLGSGSQSWQEDTVIEVEPRFTEWQILEAVRDAIHALPSNLHAVGTTTATFSTTEQSVTSSALATTGFTRILSATRTARSQEDRLVKFNVKVQEYAGAYEVVRQEGIEKSVTVNLTYAHPFVTSTLDPDTNLVTTVGMSAEMLDIPALGAAASLMLADEATRLDLHAAGDSRGDGALNPGDRARYSLVLQAQYDRRVSQEARRLMAKYGVRADAVTSSGFPTTLR